MLFSLVRPTPARINRFIDTQRKLPFTYDEVGASRSIRINEAHPLPRRYHINHNRVRLGTGIELYEKAKAAVSRWEMFQLAWASICWPDTPIRQGSTIAILSKTNGIWTLNACRIAYMMEDFGDMERFGFGYGTLPGHVADGEERFMVEWNRPDDSVWFDIYSFAEPRDPMVRLALLYFRHLQKRFAHDAAAAIGKALNGR